MKRFLGMLLSAIAVLSLVLCVAVAVLWVRSYEIADGGLWTRTWAAGSTYGYTQYRMDSVKGSFGVAIAGNQSSRAVSSGGFRWEPINAASVYLPTESRYGFYYHSNTSGTFWFRSLFVPHWLIVLLFAALPAAQSARIIARRRRRHLANRVCTECGYDLRASPERCPECGTSRLPLAPASQP
jgi:hypothetical protein